MANLNYTDSGLSFRSSSLDEALTISECFVAENSDVGKLTWHNLLTRSSEEIAEMHPVVQLGVWGVETDPASLEKIQSVLTKKRKDYRWNMLPLEEVKLTPQFQKALDTVKSKFGGPLKDGRLLFPYQLELAAFVVCRHRILNALDMGLGKTISTLVGVASNDANKKNLIITMSRNVNDWIRELELLGFEDDYILLENPMDLHSNKRFHVVSYEKWSTERMKFRQKVHTECPQCQVSFGGYFKRELQYCTICKTKAAPLMVEKENGRLEPARWSDNDLPEECPDCGAEWKKGKYTCGEIVKRRSGTRICGYSVIELKKPALYSYYHNGYDSSIIDEAHYIKAGDSKRALSVRRIKTKTKVALSGTPAENGADDLFWLIGWLTGFSSRFEDPIEALASTLKPFQGFGKLGMEHFREYYGGGKKRRVLDIDSVQARASNHEKLWAILDSLMVRKRKQDADVKGYIAVPAPKHHRYHLDLYDAERELYDKVVEDFREWYELELMKKEAAENRGETYRINTITICVWMDKLRKAASCPWMFHEYDATKGVTTSKLNFLETKAKDLLRREKKMLVFSGHRETIEQLMLTLDDVVPGKTADYIHGGVDMKYRWEIMKRFQDPNDPLSILIMSHRTGAESYTLTEGKAVFIYDLGFNGKKIEQCYSRAVRLGQRDVVDIYWLMGIGTIDVNIHGLVLSKISGVNLAVDREELDLAKLATEFEGDPVTTSSGFDMEQFAKDMLKSGTKREDIA